MKIFDVLRSDALGLRSLVLGSLGIGSLLGLHTACGGVPPDQTGSSGSASATGEVPVNPAVRTLTMGGDGIATPALDPDDPNKIIPVSGVRKLSPSAIRIDPDVILPEELMKEVSITAAERAQIIELIEHMQPLHESLTSDHHDRQYHDQLKLLDKLFKAERPQVGYAALHAFTNYPGKHENIKRSLLQVGARVAPDNAKNLLTALAFTYGYAMSDRAEAIMLLGETAPQEYFNRARAYLERKGDPFQTAPQDEFFVRGWLNACEASGESPVEMMSSVATNFALGQAARHLAVETLKDYTDDPLARGALETTLVESTGNGYIRKKAAQSIAFGYAKEDAAQLFDTVIRRESNIDFARFLDDMIQSNFR